MDAIHPIMDQLASLSQSLWQEPTLERLVRKYLTVMRDTLGVPEPMFLGVTVHNGRFTLQPTDFDIPQGKALTPQLIDSLEAHLNVVKLASQEFTEGVNAIQIGDQSLSFALIGDGKGDAGVVVWERSGATPEQVALIDFLTRQVQHSAKWFARLDKTQALLYRDDLTGLYNYRYLDVTLDAELRRVGRFSTSFCLLFIDLDNFKPVNDHHGHLAGGQVLRQVADVLRECLREVDSVFRYGGDEYLVLMVEASSQAGLLAAERIRKRIEAREFRVEGGKIVRLTASIGVAASPEHATDKEAIIRIADQNMYRSKNGGKNRVSVAVRDGGDDRKVDPATMRKATHHR